MIAESDRTIEADGYLYFPRETVRMNLLRPATKTADDRVCPNGVQFYDLADGKDVSLRAAWSYEKPGPAMKEIDHWMGFWEDVEID